VLTPEQKKRVTALIKKGLPEADAEAHVMKESLRNQAVNAEQQERQNSSTEARPEKRKVGRPKKIDSVDKRSLKAVTKIVDTRAAIESQSAIDASALGYMTSVWACASMPHSEMEPTYFKRSNGQTTLKIIADPEYGLPYGRIPRIIMAWLCTEAKITSSQVLKLGRSQNEFMRKLGMTATGGNNGSIARLKEQATRLFHSTISLTNDVGSEHRFKNITIADEGMLLWNPKAPDEKTLWESTITLSARFYDEIQTSSVPIDMRVINSMRSPLAIDIYIWLTWRIREIKRGQTTIPWESLKNQFGANYSDTPKGLFNFKSEFIKKLKDVCFYYPEAKVEVTDSGLKLQQSPPHIPSLKRSKTA